MSTVAWSELKYNRPAPQEQTSILVNAQTLILAPQVSRIYNITISSREKRWTEDDVSFSVSYIAHWPLVTVSE